MLVHWDGLSALEPTWEDNETFVKTYPAFNLVEKVVLEGEGNDTLLRETSSPNEVMEDNARYGPANESESTIAMPQRLKTIPFWRKVYV